LYPQLGTKDTILVVSTLTATPADRDHVKSLISSRTGHFE